MNPDTRAALENAVAAVEAEYERAVYDQERCWEAGLDRTDPIYQNARRCAERCYDALVALVGHDETREIVDFRARRAVWGD